uniref:MBL fold metallo-hydrolase n=1 Tax=Acetatifactor sp. TaxID=1872090 RepID=UPI00405660A4
MNIVTLVEDTPGWEGCIYEHGLSFYVETEKHKLLVDTGATDAFLKNAEKLGIDLNEVDTVILSHGHYDHSGGIMPFTKVNTHAQIYLQNTAGGDYYSVREKGEEYIGIDKEILTLPQVRLLEGDVTIDEELSLFTNITGRRLWPKSNLRLKRKEKAAFVQDTFEHEQCLVITYKGRKLLLSGCAHNGILNILDKYRELYGAEPDVVISGFHMVRKEYSEETLQEIRDIAEELHQYKTVFYTGHCTGQVAFDVMKAIMGEQLCEIHSGLNPEIVI